MASGLIDPRIASVVARRVAGDRVGEDTHLIAALGEHLDVAVPRSEQLVAEASGIPPPPPVAWSVVSRGAWAEANIRGMTTMLEPLTDRVSTRLETLPWGVRMAQRALVSAELGGLLGFVSKRVLGQYDLLVSEEGRLASQRKGARSLRRRGIAPGTVLYFVGPNMVETQGRLGFVPEDFALWVALHEVTHRFQFAGVPWLADRFFSLLSAYFESVDLDARKLAGRLTEAARALAARSVPPEERNAVYLLATAEQRLVLDDIQALMAVVEGHGNYVMDSVGARVIPSFGQMRSLFERRRAQQTAVQRAVGHVIGLEMKLRQYEMGQRFCREVVTLGGPGALARLWVAPESFPSLSELREPRLWLKRTA
jgi:coenzyme F420 biosynthesis associated uncharacterized protein